MYMKTAGSLALLAQVLLALGCGGGGDRIVDPPGVAMTLQGQFEKRALTSAGLSSAVTIQPARYCYAELVADQGGAILASGYLGSDGMATATVPQGVQAHLVLYAQYEVPRSGGNYFMHGSVKQGTLQAKYTDINAFNTLPNWSVTSASVTTGPGTLAVRALNSTPLREAGAFNIADQAVAFGLTLQPLEAALVLPNLHVFWQATTPATGWPAVASTATGAVLKQTSNRAVFQMTVRGTALGAPDTGVDEFNDGILQQRFASLLFAPYSYPADGSSASSVIRGDNDSYVRADRGYQAESSAAFITGFCDFLSGVVRNDPALVSVNSNGDVSTFRLDSHGQFAHDPNQGEFYSDAVAVSLYNIWKTTLGGGTAGLQPLWNATFATTPNALLNAPLGCYPTYLAGLSGLVSGATWTAIQGQLAQENIGDVTSSLYFSSAALWSSRIKPFTAAGTLHTYTAAENVYYDRDQAQTYLFTQGAAGPCTLTVTPLDGQDCFLELIGSNGILGVSYDQRSSAQPRTLSYTNLAAGVYAVRVRVGYTTADFPAARYTLTVN